ncbi:nucleotidyltransferase [Candidatus Azobacteroides pseudotrichonymphae]|jgi:hypothetical protein|uniref:Nucleotidyltransferase n=1 Tax=Azobacteroides pseudotrichonymphae genomovar. CFP2 TaxID=511995 RepID=B6YRB2_AZOPC|nr:nucleotidyltransferase [Candidatus Azobacteroides pseudotrichonymphae]MDR0530264.1 nucleotidyltransferase [Bacteroidales bacterium OttesenSCG-928-I14]BAG83734.1 conserved hypothetical protein [Candidatus Azobacteroides pseudotrichonymphae genomovar. CFP2]
MKLTLLVLAAGMGSRYGGLKQLDGLGPNGETIMDYSVFDAVRNGFDKVVFIIRKSFEKDFKENFLKKYEHVVPTEIVFQSLDKLPHGFSLNTKRIKPWGTNHAIMMGKEIIHEPFAVINADDFYGQDSFKILAYYLGSLKREQNSYIMVSYKLGNTLSKSGAVARGICETSKDGFLAFITERNYIISDNNGKVKYRDDINNWITIDEDTPVSMNMWGFTPEYFNYSENLFIDFLIKNQNNLKAEFFIPSVVNQLITNKQVKVQVLKTSSQWFGITYLEERASVVSKIRDLIKRGEYPKKLF